MLGSGGTGGGGARSAWPLAPTAAAAEPFSRYGVYSLFPGAGSPAPAIGALYHATHKVTDALFSSHQYSTFGAVTPPPGSPYSPVPQLELLAKGITTSIAAATTHLINSHSTTPITTLAITKKDHQNHQIHATHPSHATHPNLPTHPTHHANHPSPHHPSHHSPHPSLPTHAPHHSTPHHTTPTSSKRCCWLKQCICHSKVTKSLPQPAVGGCSRTNPIEWSGGGGVTVKREPGAAATPCQVAEVTTSESMVKVEVGECHGEGMVVSVPASVANGNIPVGIAVARQRLQQDLSTNAATLTAQGLLAPTSQPLKDIARIQDMESSGVGGAVGLTVGGASAGVLQCSDDRAPGLAAWPMGGASTHATPTLWQYPAPMPVEPMLPLPIPVPPLGYQLVRDPSSGHFLLIPTATLEQLGQAVVWPSYSQPSSHVLLPPPPPLAPLQLLSSSSATADFLATSTTLHQHTQTHSTRLVALTAPAPSLPNEKRQKTIPLPTLPMPLPAHTLIKIEADCTATATLDDTPFVLYQHPNLILQQPSMEPQTTITPVITATPCKSQATSPVTCLTPPPEVIYTSSVATPIVATISAATGVDASNQTDHPVLEEESDKEEMSAPEEIESVPCEPLLVTPQPIPSVEPEPEIKMESNKPDPDISGLELLSNSIVEFENISRNESYTSPVKFESSPVKSTEHGDDVLTGIAHMTLKDCEVEVPASTPTAVDDNLGGLGLLCALAEQRFMEEVSEQRKEKRKINKSDPKEPKVKRAKLEHHDQHEHHEHRAHHDHRDHHDHHVHHNHHDLHDHHDNDTVGNVRELEREKLSVLRKVVGERGIVTVATPENNNNCSCRESKNGKSRNWSPEFMSAVERDMRQELADLQRRCKEKKLELSKLTPSNKKVPSTPPPQLDKMEPLLTLKPTQELLKPPVLSPIIPSKPDEPYKRNLCLSQDSSDLSSTSTTPEKVSSSKKRKVGRPKKLMTTSGLRATTETIVAKKPRVKPGFVGYILAAKSKIQIQQKAQGYRESSPPRYSEDTMSSPGNSPVKVKNAKAVKSSTSSTTASSSPRNIASTFTDKKSDQRSKIRPKLKAELALKTRPEVNSDSSDEESSSDSKLPVAVLDSSSSNYSVPSSAKASSVPLLPSCSSSKALPTVKALPEKAPTASLGRNATVNKEEEEDLEEDEIMEIEEINEEASEEACEEACEEISEEVSEEISEEASEAASEVASEEASEEAVRSEEDTRCILTAQHLSVDKLRVLTAMGGLFYAGHLTAVRAPDVYAITLDGERGNRPHIMCREEILRDAIVEVSPSNTSELVPGTRLCAYWSQQYRCLYPGTVAEPGTPDPHLDSRFVCVEFDDGDSGRIAIEDIRLLPPDYPIIEYDPNPLLSLSKRRRRTSVNSVTEERRLSQQKTTPATTTEPPKPSNHPAEKENTDINRQVEQDNHRERKRLKKRRKEKLKKHMSHEDKKKKRKHRCCDEKCKHRKHHKKHRKHKKHHHSRSEAEENPEVVEEVVEPVQEPVEEEVEAIMELDDDEEEEDVAQKKAENKARKAKKKKERRESAESRSKMAAFLPARQLWSWSGRGYKRVGVRGRARKQFFKAIQRGKESIMVGDCAVFLSTGRPDRPYIGKIEAMWEAWGTNMVVKVKWFYHPEETVGCPSDLKYPGALFESPHVDENDVQTISHKCEVLPLQNYTDKLGPEPQRYETIYDNNDIYYLAGYYDPTTTTLSMKPEIPFAN